MTQVAVLVAAASAVGSFLLVWLLLPLLRRHALARPNERSSHRRPTPQGGGIAVVATALGGGAAGLALTGLADGRAAWLAAACLGIAATGLADDLRPLSPGLRLVIQAACAAVVVLLVLPERVLPLPVPSGLGAVLLGIALVWWINLTNFMDGIDWMTVAEFGPMTAALCGMALLGFGSPEVAVAAAALGGGLAGFAPFNRPVARLFLGDVGSLPVGLATGPQAASSAAVKSATRSSTCSSPTEIRTSPSAIPMLVRSSALSRWWVDVAGCVTRLFASPRLFEIRASLSPFMNRKAPALPPSTSTAISVEPPLICRRMISACGWSGRPG